MRLSNNPVKPSIHVYYNKSLVDFSKFEDILWGIEEEGVPYKIQEKNDREAQLLAYDASETSELGVGIGVDCESIVLHYIKLKKNKPLHKISADSSQGLLRVLGGNGARLVKRMPFKNLEDRELEDRDFSSRKQIEKEIRFIVEQVIARMKLG